MSDIINWITENWEMIGLVTTIIFVVASIVTGLTKTQKDNQVLEVIGGILRRLSLLSHKDETGTFVLPFTKANTKPKK